MKQRLITSLILLSFVIGVTPALAEGLSGKLKVRADDSSGSIRVQAEGKAEIENDDDESDDDATSTKSESREDRAETKASSTDRRIKLFRSLAERKAEHAGQVFLATIERLEKIADRIDSRIAKVEAEGGFATESKTFVAEARGHLAEARTNVEVFASIEFTADTASENFGRVRDAAVAVKMHLREAHRSLMMAVRSLKPGNSTNNGGATTTASTTATTTATTTAQ